MRGGVYRLLGGFGALVLIWIAVYWAVDPPAARISFGDADQPDATPDVGSDPAVETADPPVPRLSAVESPRFEEYTVRAGDTFESIARARYGSVRHAEAVARANPFVSPDRLRAGQQLRLPVDPSNVQGRALTAEAGPVAARPVEYEVRPGDTLTGIAKAYYGSVREAERIFQANRDRLRSRDSLRVGQVLVLPPRDEPPGSG